MFSQNYICTKHTFFIQDGQLELIFGNNLQMYKFLFTISPQLLRFSDFRSQMSMVEPRKPIIDTYGIFELKI